VARSSGAGRLACKIENRAGRLGFSLGRANSDIACVGGPWEAVAWWLRL